MKRYITAKTKLGDIEPILCRVNDAEFADIRLEITWNENTGDCYIIFRAGSYQSAMLHNLRSLFGESALQVNDKDGSFVVSLERLMDNNIIIFNSVMTNLYQCGLKLSISAGVSNRGVYCIMLDNLEQFDSVENCEVIKEIISLPFYEYAGD